MVANVVSVTITVSVPYTHTHAHTHWWEEGRGGDAMDGMSKMLKQVQQAAQTQIIGMNISRIYGYIEK